MADLTAGHAALARGAWSEARASFEAALDEEETAAAWEGLSWALWWLDEVDACFAAREAAYRGYREDGDLRGAARLALWLSDDHSEFRRQEAVAGGWFQRASRLLDELPPAPEHAWLWTFEAHEAMAAGDFEAALRLTGAARERGREQGSIDAEMFALATEGVVLVARGDVADGMRALDEAAAAALAGEFDDLRAAGWTCCLLIGACERVRDYDRAAQWCAEAEAFGRKRDIRFVNGICRAHYGAVLCWHGDWEAAERELTGALQELTETRPGWRRHAVVRLGELRRRQGRLAEALELFAAAEHDPLARLGRAEAALDRGDAETARDEAERILRAVGEAAPVARAGALELLVRAECASGAKGPAGGADAADGLSAATGAAAAHGPAGAAGAAAADGPSAVTSAAAHAAGLRAIAAQLRTRPLLAAAAYCEGLAAAAAGDHQAALARHEEAVEGYAAAAAPLETARARLGAAEALAALGRSEAARGEAAAAVEALEAIGAEAECGRARAVARRLGGVSRGELSAREVEVLRLVAEGLSDRQIAGRLTLSEHTVHRHVSNIHTKLRCSSRAAAVALGHRRGLL
jgi:ATP/maltotriose-dependent transcriptional regulator MalT